VVIVRSGLAISHAGWVRSLGIGAALVVALWNLNKLRLKYARKGARFLEDERRAERKRIARELHDTLLQGLQGILLEFEVLSSRLPEQERERAAKIERKLRHIVMDGRNAINALRLPEDREKDWVSAVLEIGERAAADSKMAFVLKIEGQPWSLPIKVRTEVLAIVREGLRNAFEHSRAKAVLVVIRYAKRGLKISIQDNGIGVSEQQLKLRQSEGHWGIAGMRERAEKLYGRLTILSQPSKGTTVNLIMLRRATSMKSRVPCTSGKGHRWGRRKPQLSLARLLTRIGR
jgi:signal transduction histidine kinase